MAELQPLEGPTNGGSSAVGATVGVLSENMGGPFLGSKRQRRPSVRLGDIGDQPATLSYDSFVRRTKQWSEFKNRNPSLKDANRTSKTRPLTNLVMNGGDCHETLDGEDKNISGDGNLDLLATGNRKGRDLKARKGAGGTGGGGTKRVRSNWVSKVDDAMEGDDKFSGGDDGGEGYRDFDPEGSESPLKDQSPIQSLENMATDLRQASDRAHGNEREVQFPGQRRILRARVSESRDHDPVELDGPSDTDARDWKCGTSADRNGIGERDRHRSLEDGVRMWLNGLGLGRYAPVFEIHEVDDEVLPLLTLEDLKDMGINAVGSRRKMYCAIQKLGKGFS